MEKRKKSRYEYNAVKYGFMVCDKNNLTSCLFFSSARPYFSDIF